MSASLSAYVIGHISIRDEARWAEYRSKVPATLELWGAELLLRAQTAAVLAGRHTHTDVVVIRFPDLASASGWFNSAAYQALIPLRNAAADVDLISYVG
jgi:uncharacterized protein (DUF1330 family)